MANKPSIKVDYAILCDDIRKEDNGKLMLIGIYTGDILIQNFPANLSLAMLLHGKASEDCSVSMKIRYRAKFDNGKPLEALVSSNMEIKGTQKSNEFYIPVPRVPFELRGVGKLSVAYKIDNKRWSTLLEKNIKKQDLF